MNLEGETVSVARETPRQADVTDLISRLDAYLSELYPAESNHLVDIEGLGAPDVRFFVARYRGKAVGCGAIRLDVRGYAEVKRMFVTNDVRGKGLGQALLRRLEQEARESKLSLVRLETGTLQPEALGLYLSEGYREIPPFGDYLPDPLSIFMEKHIGGAGEKGVAADEAASFR